MRKIRRIRNYRATYHLYFDKLVNRMLDELMTELEAQGKE